MNKKQIMIILVILLLVPQALWARYQIEITPSLRLSELYDDNIYLNNTDEINDWITSITPGLNLNIFSQKNNFIFNYSPSIVRYKNKDENNTVRQALMFSFNSAVSQRFEFNISDTFLRSEDPLDDTNDIVGVRKTRNIYRRNNGNAGIRYTFGSSNTFMLGVRHAYLKNQDINIDNGTIIDPYAGYTYWFNVKHGLEITAGYTKADFSRDGNTPPGDDYSGFNEGVGYRYRFDPHSTFFVSYDFTTRDFKGNTTDYEVYDGTIGFEKNVSEDMSYNISIGYFIWQNDMDVDDDGFSADISLTKKINRGSFNFSGRSGWSEAYLEAERRGFTKYRQLSSIFNYQVMEKLSNFVSVSYRQDKDNNNRVSKTITVNYGWDWNFFRNYSMSLDYSCSTRDDDLNTDDYMVNRVMFILRWSRPYR